MHLCVIFYFTIDKIENLLMLPSPEMLKIIKMSVTKAAHWTQLKLTQVCFLSRVQSASVNVSLLNHLIVMWWSSLYEQWRLIHLSELLSPWSSLYGFPASFLKRAVHSVVNSLILIEPSLDSKISIGKKDLIKHKRLISNTQYFPTRPCQKFWSRRPFFSGTTGL